VAKFAETYQDGSQYFILLIVTDGVITDMPQTKQVSVSDNSYLQEKGDKKLKEG
jgi:hypothetical protein